LALPKKLQVHHQRILETCHIRNRKPWDADAEKKSLYCETRFVPREKAIELFVDVLNNQVDENGHRVSVIFLGHAFHNDVGHLNEQWKLKVNKLENVIFIIGNLATLGRQAGVILDSDIMNRDFDKMLRNFGVTSFDGCGSTTVQTMWSTR
jgi:hypothetical protein